LLTKINMTDNNIIELTPFRADLTRALARRGERLLASSELTDEVAALEPLEAYYIIREIGLEQALPNSPGPEPGTTRKPVSILTAGAAMILPLTALMNG